MASKKTWKRRAKEACDESSALYQRLEQRTAELQQVDDLLRGAELPGPTLDQWAYQFADFFRQLLVMRGIVPAEVSGTGIPIPTGVPSQGMAQADPVGDGTHELMTHEDFVRASQVPAGEGHFA